MRKEIMVGGWSRRDVNRLRAQMTEQGRDIDDIAQEIRFLTRGSMLAAYRMALGLSQPEVVDRFTEAAPDAVMDQPLLSRLEAFPTHGSRAPLATQIITLAEIYGTTPLRLLTADALDRLDAHERAVLIRCDTAFSRGGGTSTALEPSGAASRPPAGGTRPDPQKQSAAGPLERQVEMAASKALRFAVTVEGSNVGPETLEQLHDEVSRLAHAYPRQALPTLLGDLVAIQDVAFRLLEGRQRPAESLDLYLLTGVICGMLAKASHDLGDPKAAMTQARTAYICADNAGHNGLRAWTRGLQSMIGYWAGWPNEALRYAQLASEPAAGTRGTTSVWLPAQEARVWAALGESDRAEEALARANDARDTVDGDELDELGGIMTFELPRHLYYVADTRIWIPGAEEAAARSAAAAIRAYEEATPEQRSFSDEAGARADLALARANSGDAEGSLEALRPVLELPHEQRIGGIVASAMRVHTALGAPPFRRATVARSGQEEIEEFARTVAKTVVPPRR